MCKLPLRYTKRIEAGEGVASVLCDFVQDEGDSNYIDTLGELCENGGYPDENGDPTYQYIAYEPKEGRRCVLEMTAHFDEKVFGGGCPDMYSIFPTSGPVILELDLETNEVQWISGVEDD